MLPQDPLTLYILICLILWKGHQQKTFLGYYEKYDNTSNPMETCVLGDRYESFFELDD